MKTYTSMLLQNYRPWLPYTEVIMLPEVSVYFKLTGLNRCVLGYIVFGWVLSTTLKSNVIVYLNFPKAADVV